MDEHPSLGRKLVIECGGRTRDGGYKGPVTWDRWRFATAAATS